MYRLGGFLTRKLTGLSLQQFYHDLFRIRVIAQVVKTGNIKFMVLRVHFRIHDTTWAIPLIPSRVLKITNGLEMTAAIV